LLSLWLFRQAVLDDRPPVIARVREELEKFVATRLNAG